jgi:hypothetical protein
MPMFTFGYSKSLVFSKVNNAAYKWFVDRPIIQTARDIGLGGYVQPTGHFRNRGYNFK